MMNIGIICEGPTDYIILKEIVDKITGTANYYVQLQPDPDLLGEYGNGWKGIWKWCNDNGTQKERLMKDIEPSLDILIIQMDGDVSRKEKISHCCCKSTICQYKNQYNPLNCDRIKELRNTCPITLPCVDHTSTVDAYMEHLEQLISDWLPDLNDTCIVIPCDSTEAWIIAAFDEREDAESIIDPWTEVIAKKKDYNNIRIHGKQKTLSAFKAFATVVSEKWERVTELCISAKRFEDNIVYLAKNEEVSSNSVVHFMP